MRTGLCIALGLLPSGFAGTGRGGDWPQFRGPGGSATSADPAPTEWGPDKNVAWKVKLPGYGWSCPVVSGDKVFVTTAVSDNQKKPSSGGFGPGGPGGPGGFPGGPGGFPGGPPGGPGGGGRGGFGRQQAPPNEIYKWQVYCLSAADGKVVWERTAAERRPALPKHGSNTYATETPATDGERVYAYFGAVGAVVAYDFTGNLAWKADLGTYQVQFGHGTASSPAVHAGRVFVLCDNEDKSFLAALDAKSGKELWRTPRQERTSWSSPVVWKNSVRTEVVCAGGSKARGYDPETGKVLWELGGMAGQCKASPVPAGDLLYVGTGGGPGGMFGRPGGGPPGGGDGPPRGGDVAPPGGPGGPGGRQGGRSGGGKPLFAVKAGATGDITLAAKATSNEGVAWHLPTAGPAAASPVVYEGYLYVPEERGGLISCYDAKTGKQEYKERVPGAKGFTASPWAAGGKVYCPDDSGTTFVLKAGPTFEVIGTNKLGEMTWSSPAVGGGAIFLRTVDHLFCIREPGAGK